MNTKISARNILAMARGVVVVDENISGIESELLKRNIKVISIPKGTDDEIIKQVYLPRRILITTNSAHFIDDASSYEYGIIALDHLKFKDSKNMAVLVSKALIKHQLWAKGHGFILRLNDKGEGTIENLVI